MLATTRVSGCLLSIVVKPSLKTRFSSTMSIRIFLTRMRRLSLLDCEVVLSDTCSKTKTGKVDTHFNVTGNRAYNKKQHKVTHSL